MEATNHRSARKFYGIAILLIITLFVIGYVIFVPHKATYSRYMSTTRTEQANYLRIKDSNSHKLEYDFTYKGSCPECIKLQPTIAPLLANKKKQHVPLIVLNENNQGLMKYFVQNGLINHYPTIAVRYKGYLIYQYTGHSKKIFKEMFRGIDPENGRRFKKSIPEKSYVRNDIDHINQVRNGFTTSINNK